MLDEVLGHGPGRLHHGVQDLTESLEVAILEHPLDDAAAILVRRHPLRPLGDRGDHEAAVSRHVLHHLAGRSSLDSSLKPRGLLDHVIAVGIFDAFDDLPPLMGTASVRLVLQLGHQVCPGVGL